MVVMLVVQMPIMEIVGVAVVRHGLMPARRAVHMTMAGVFVAFTFHRINLHSKSDRKWTARRCRQDCTVESRVGPTSNVH